MIVFSLLCFVILSHSTLSIITILIRFLSYPKPYPFSFLAPALQMFLIWITHTCLFTFVKNMIHKCDKHSPHIDFVFVCQRNSLENEITLLIST